MKKKVFIKTFGCQMNEYDSNRIYDSIKQIGYVKTENQENADCYILNTCHIRDKAKDKVYHEIGRVKKLYKDKKKPIMIVAGCVAQAENSEMIKREKFIDLIIGPQSYQKINIIIQNFDKENKVEETDFDSVSKFRYFDNIKNNNTKISSFLTIQEGCDKFCHFCVVPYTRGPEYSRPFQQIIAEAEVLIKNGSKEITFLGQNVNAYSYRDGSKEYRLSNLIRTLSEYKEIERIRFTTSHPRDMTEDLIECYKDTKKLVPFVHLPIQSGSNRILDLMNRKHTVEYYLNIYEKLIKINPEIKFSSDFIIGYPGENELDFKDTLSLLNKIKFINSYSFIFSPRPGTKAANLEITDKNRLKERLLIVQEKLFKNQIDLNKSLENETVNVLVENKLKDQEKYFGRNRYLNSVIFEADESYIGKMVKVNILKSNQNSLFGKISTNMKAA